METLIIDMTSMEFFTLMILLLSFLSQLEPKVHQLKSQVQSHQLGLMHFSHVPPMKKITIPGSVTAIDYGAFLSRSGFDTVNIGEGLIAIESYAFGSCSSLKNFTIPSSVTLIGYCEFFFMLCIRNSHY